MYQLASMTVDMSVFWLLSRGTKVVLDQRAPKIACHSRRNGSNLLSMREILRPRTCGMSVLYYMQSREVPTDVKIHLINVNLSRCRSQQPQAVDYLGRDPEFHSSTHTCKPGTCKHRMEDIKGQETETRSHLFMPKKSALSLVVADDEETAGKWVVICPAKSGQIPLTVFLL